MKAVVLAAGMGKRLQSEEFDMPKVLREIKGRSLLSYVLENIDFIPKRETVIVVGYKREKVIASVSPEYKFAVQDKQLGTGHAVVSAAEELEGYDGDVIVLCGDMPMLKRDTYKALIEKHREENADCTILSAVLDEELTHGRIIRKNGQVTEIVEHKDCDDEQRKVREYNSAVYVFNAKKLLENLKKLKNNNAQGEYYLTDVPKLMLEDGSKVSAFVIDDFIQIYGVNTVEDLALCEKYL